MVTWTPVVDRVVDDALLQTVPHVYQTLFQIVNVSHLRPINTINTVLHRTPDVVVNRVEVEPVERPQIGSNERLKAGTSHCSTRPSHGPYGPVHCPVEKWSHQKLHGYRAASPVSAACPDNMLHLFWCQGPRIWGWFGPASTHRQIPRRTLLKLSECATTDPLQYSSSLTL